METSFSEILNEFIERTTVEYIDLRATKAAKALSPWASKFGGTPYLPQEFKYPTSTNSRTDFNDPKNPNPLKLLAQVNFEELPPLQGFPTRGLLQFYLDPKDEMYAWKNDTSSYKVVYHPKIEKNLSNLQEPPGFHDDEIFFPIQGEFSITGTIKKMPMTDYDFRFENEFLRVFNKYAIDERKHRVYDIGQSDLIHDRLHNVGHRIGGYACAPQKDPRQFDAPEHTVVLLQIDSDKKYGNEISWGDSGTGTLYIRSEDLKKLDFSNVFFNWACF